MEDLPYWGCTLVMAMVYLIYQRYWDAPSNEEEEDDR